PKTQAVRIAHTVGKRKRAKILVEARKRKITILNLKEAKEAIRKEEGEEEKPEEKEEETEIVEKEKPKRRQKKKTKKRKRRTEKQ
ncbi:MAG: hypothetical protein OEW71_04890, partial [Candidatus Bathyarchaeota archaeon]|nr:hypothetical protein [Candidatus Bathyarchaeota archaeon]